MADRAASRYRAAIAVEYRNRGMGYDAIADALGYASRSGAWKAVDRCLSRQSASVAEELYARTFADLEVLHERSWAAAMAGDIAAVKQCLKAIDLRVRLIERYGATRTQR